MKTEITPEEYINIYEACNWNPAVFSKALKALGYSDELIIDNNLDLRNNPIQSLVNIKEVDGNLNLDDTPIQDIGELQNVEGYLSLSNTPIQHLGNLQTVRSDLDLDWTPIQDIGNLRYVGRNLYLRGTPISKKYSEEEIYEKVEIGLVLVLK